MVSSLLSNSLRESSDRLRPASSSKPKCSQHIQPYCRNSSDLQSSHLVEQKKKEKNSGAVDHQDPGTVKGHAAVIQDLSLDRDTQPESTRVRISESKVEKHNLPSQEPRPIEDDVADIVSKLETSLTAKFRDVTNNLPMILELYAMLPEPRMKNLPLGLCRLLLKVFGMPMKKDSTTMMRYFSLLGDAKDCGIHLNRSNWNFAMALAGRYVAKTTVTEAESALQLWREMEKVSGVKGNAITYSILFDVASKAGNYPLAEVLWNEMKERNIPMNRYHRVSRIHFYGLRGDADGVRAAYKEMVENGEMIDTVALNCMISCFLRCGEEEEALKIYEHMKSTHSKAPTLPPNDYFKARVVTKVLSMFAVVGRRVPELRPRLRELTTTTPDMRTYRLLTNYFGTQKGDLRKVAQFLDEMKWFDVPVHGGIFLGLFQGFKTYGGNPSSNWTTPRLDSVLSALLQAHDQDAESLYLGTWLMVNALQAYKRCTNVERMFEVYEEFKQRWDLAPDRAEFMESYTATLL